MSDVHGEVWRTSSSQRFRVKGLGSRTQVFFIMFTYF